MKTKSYLLAVIMTMVAFLGVATEDGAQRVIAEITAQCILKRSCSSNP